MNAEETIPETADPGRGRPLVLALLLVAATVAVYAGALGSGLLAWDDPQVIAESTSGGIARYFTGPVFHTWLPLYFLSLRIDTLFSDGPFVHHLVNLLLHLANAFLVLAIARRALKRGDLAWIAAFLFALHPAATESVIWIAERKGLLAFALAGLAWLAFDRGIGAAGAKRAGWHAAGAALLALALLAKGSALVLPLLLALQVVALDPPLRRRLADLAPYFVVAGAFSAIHYAVALAEGPGAIAGGAASRIAVAPSVLGRYAQLLFLPLWGQSLVPEVSALDVRVLFAVALVVGLVVAWRRDRRVFFGLGVAVLALTPYNNVLPKTTVLFAERYAYIAVAGFAFAAAALLGRLRPPVPALAAGAAAILLGVLGGLRANLWSDGIEVFRDADRKADSWLAAVKLGNALERAAEEGRPERWPEAADAYARALPLAADPLDEARTRYGLALARAATGADPDETLAILDEARTKLEPEWNVVTHDVETLRGRILFGLGRYEAASEAYRAAARARPEQPLPLKNLAESLLADGDTRGAIDALREALVLDRGNEEASLLLARVLWKAAERSAARAVVGGLLERRPGSPAGNCLLGQMELESGRPREARKRFEAARAASPGLPDAVRGSAAADLYLARALAAGGNREEARRLAQRSVETEPGDPATLVFLAGLTDDPTERDGLLAQAAELPGGAGARDALASLRIRRAAAILSTGREAAAVRVARSALAAEPRCLRTGTYFELREELPRIAALDEGPVQDGILLAIALALEGRFDESEDRLAAAATGARDEGDGEAEFLALLLRARLKTVRGDPAAGVRELAALAKERPADALLAFFMADALFRRAAAEQAKPDGAAAAEALYDEAREAAARAIALGPGRLAPLLKLGEVEFGAGRHLDSLRAFNQARERFPDAPEPMLDLAGLYRTHWMMSGDRTFLDEAKAQLEAAVALAPENARARTMYGEVLVDAGDSRSGEVQLRRALDTDPGLASAREALADLYVRAARAALKGGTKEAGREAEKLAERAIALKSGKAAPHLLLAEIYRSGRYFKEAFRELTEARNLEPDSAEVRDGIAGYHRDAGYALLLANRRADAMDEFRKALAAGSESMDLTPVRAMLEEEEAAEGEGESRVTELLAERTEEAHRWFEQAGKRLDAGDAEGAVEALRNSLRARSTGEAWCWMGTILAGQGRDEGAEEAYRTAVRVKPTFAEGWKRLGSFHYERGDRKAALEAWEAYLRIPTGDAPDPGRAQVEALVEELRKSAGGK